MERRDLPTRREVRAQMLRLLRSLDDDHWAFDQTLIEVPDPVLGWRLVGSLEGWMTRDDWFRDRCGLRLSCHGHPVVRVREEPDEQPEVWRGYRAVAALAGSAAADVCHGTLLPLSRLLEDVSYDDFVREFERTLRELGDAT